MTAYTQRGFVGLLGATFNRGALLGEVGRHVEAITVFDALVEQNGDSPELILREQVARALVNKGAALGNLNCSEEEIAVYDSVFARFGDAPELNLREAVAKALRNKGVALGKLKDA